METEDKKQESGWLIEHQNNSGGHRWLRVIIENEGSPSASAIFDWTAHSEIAIRFTHREFAQQFCYLHKNWCFGTIITEHAWGLK